MSEAPAETYQAYDPSSHQPSLTDRLLARMGFEQIPTASDRAAMKEMEGLPKPPAEKTTFVDGLLDFLGAQREPAAADPDNWLIAGQTPKP